MIVTHNMEDPSKPGALLGSSIVDTDGTVPSKYNAGSLKSTITWPDPASFNEPSTSDVQNLADARYDVVNRAKLIEIAIGSPSSALTEYVSAQGETNLLIASPFGNWRDYKVNGFCQISDRVLLDAGDTINKINLGVEYSVSSVAKTTGETSIMKTMTNVANLVNTAAETIDAVTGSHISSQSKGDFVSRWQNMPVYNPAETKGKDIGDLTFSFHFGQGQLFSGEEEVVKPILALANIFLPHFAGGHKMTGPYMSALRAKGKFVEAFLTKGVTNIFNKIKSIDGETVANSGAGVLGGFVSSINDITETLYEVQDITAQSALSETSTIVGTIGGYVFGPLCPANVNWEFDFSQVDEYGYPCAGKITFGGLFPIMLLSSGDIFRRWGYSTTATKVDSSSGPLWEQLQSSGASEWITSKATSITTDINDFLNQRKGT